MTSLRRWVAAHKREVIATAILVPLITVMAGALYLASVAGELPWQAEPTRIPITPFADLPTRPAPGATPSPGA